ncbi:phospholipase C, phosphocholine-specific [Kribbella flavida DSM 17836]|uniref:phospholipase C n=1 Tax=Kribbella flavida (strain DSM 17836 / JCM 10339 / NBRC 14399) TaxID=479435 RepID=D2PXR8_KRIFD|nr:phospholipase C, phosphocholine-specific [Kribbella flavida]ADB31710.1 phospholipase C, phosphocholine-specific [Kribbella flavida DSM 17836]
MTEISRRLVLGSAAGGAALSLLPPSLHTAMARPPRKGGLKAVEHVIVLMQENRSFDHYFGTLRGVRGFGDRRPLRLRDGRSVFQQPKPGGGEVLPFSIRKAAAAEGRDPGDIQYLAALAHGFTDATQAWGNGWNDDWVAAKTAAAMTHYERRDIPLQYELAETFTICDAYHCSVNGSTNPNRNYLWSGTTGYEPGTTQRAVTNAAYSYDHAGYDWTAYPERLEQAGVSWQIYQEWDNFTDNAVEYFRTFKDIGQRILANVPGGYRTTEEFYDKLFAKTPEQRALALRQLDAAVAKLPKWDQKLFRQAMYRSEPETLVPRLRADIKAGRLPQVSWLVPSAIDSEHPSTSTPVGSANLVYDLLDAIAEDPEVWSKTVLLINFDENDGYFDHVPPPVAPRPAAGNGDDWYDGRPIGLGPRVPMTVVSPWTIGGHVNSQVFDHTSVLRFLETWSGVREPNISKWRRTACGDLTSAFDFHRAYRQPSVDRPGTVPAPVDRWKPTPPAEQALPVQEPGRRPARGLPYQPVASGAVADGILRLRLANEGKEAAHFAVYPYGGELPAPGHFDVRDAEVVPVEVDGPYELAVQGPNRFWVELAGSTDGAAAGLDVRVDGLGGVLRIELENHGSKPLTVKLRSKGYGSRTITQDVRGRQTRTLTWPTDQGWYDVEATVAEDPTYRRRHTGHAETGRPSVTG